MAATKHISDNELRLKMLRFMVSADPGAPFKDIYKEVQGDPSIRGVGMTRALKIFLSLTQEADESGSSVSQFLEKASCPCGFAAPLLGSFCKNCGRDPDAAETDTNPPPPVFERKEIAIDPSVYVGCGLAGCVDEACETPSDPRPSGGVVDLEVCVEKPLKASSEQKPAMLVSDEKRTIKTLVDESHPSYHALWDSVGTSSRTMFGFKAYFTARLEKDGMLYVDITRTLKRAKW